MWPVGVDLEKGKDGDASGLQEAGGDIDVQAAADVVDRCLAASAQIHPIILHQPAGVASRPRQRDDAQRRWVASFFEREVRPLLVPVGLDPSHPFPQVANKSLNFIARLTGADAFGRANTIAIVKVPRVLPRVIRMPEALAGVDAAGRPRQAFVLLTSVIRAHLAELFPGREVEAFSQFRVTRDSDLEIDSDDVTNLRQALRSGLTTRHFGQAVRLEVVNTCPEELAVFLLHQFELPQAALIATSGDSAFCFYTVAINRKEISECLDSACASFHFLPQFFCSLL